MLKQINIKIGYNGKLEEISTNLSETPVAVNNGENAGGRKALAMFLILAKIRYIKSGYTYDNFEQHPLFSGCTTENAASSFRDIVCASSPKDVYKRLFGNTDSNDAGGCRSVLVEISGIEKRKGKFTISFKKGVIDLNNISIEHPTHGNIQCARTLMKFVREIEKSHSNWDNTVYIFDDYSNDTLDKTPVINYSIWNHSYEFQDIISTIDNYKNCLLSHKSGSTKDKNRQKHLFTAIHSMYLELLHHGISIQFANNENLKVLFSEDYAATHGIVKYFENHIIKSFQTRIGFFYSKTNNHFERTIFLKNNKLSKIELGCIVEIALSHLDYDQKVNFVDLSKLKDDEKTNLNTCIANEAFMVLSTNPIGSDLSIFDYNSKQKIHQEIDRFEYLKRARILKIDENYRQSKIEEMARDCFEISEL